MSDANHRALSTSLRGHQFNYQTFEHGSHDSGRTFAPNRDQIRRIVLPQIRNLFTSSTAAANGKFTLPEFKNVFLRMDLLALLFKLFDHAETGELSKDKWLQFLTRRLNRNHAEHDLLEILEGICSVPPTTQALNIEQFAILFGTKHVVEKIYRAIIASSETRRRDTISVGHVMNFISHITRSRTGNPLSKENIASLDKLFRRHMGCDSLIDKTSFSKMFPAKDPFFTSRVFDVFNEDGAGRISLTTFIDKIKQYTGSDPYDKVRFLFQVYDGDRDGRITGPELVEIMEGCMRENGMRFSKEQIHDLASTFIPDQNGALAYKDLHDQLSEHPGLLENLSITIDSWLVPFGKKCPKKCIPYQFTSRNYICNNLVFLYWLLIFFIVNIVLFLYRFFEFREEYPERSTFLALARASGLCLNFDATIIVVVMLRQCLTFLRTRGASSVFPIDDNVFFHKLFGSFVVFFSLSHGLAHLLNVGYDSLYDPKINTNNCTYWQFILNPGSTAALGFGLIPGGYAFVLGVAISIVLCVMMAGATPCIRRKGHFPTFYSTHFLFVFFWILLILHCRSFWIWFLIPGTIFTLEQLNRVYNFQLGRGRTCISSVNLLPSKVTKVDIVRPRNFEFKAGDYVFIRVPKVSLLTWHPFTISSAPEEQEIITLHIRAVGAWTNKLYDYFQQHGTGLNDSKQNTIWKWIGRCFRRCRRPTSPDLLLGGRGDDFEDSTMVMRDLRFGVRGSLKSGWSNINLLTPLQDIENSQQLLENEARFPVYIDGPYGAPSSFIYQAEHAVLIGAGIGVTPFASILQSVFHRYRASKVGCPNCQHSFCPDMLPAVEKLKKVDFFWITREQESFEWFLQLLSELELAQTELDGEMERFLDLHMYLTSALDRFDMKAVMLQLALDRLYAKQKKDLISGLKSRSNPGRPNWKTIFGKIRDERKGAVTVFLCGPPTIAKEIKFECDWFGFDFRYESF